MCNFLQWSGWFVTVAIGIWELVRFIKNRTRIKFFIGLSKEEGIINHSVINIGHSPVKVIRLELKFPDGYYCDTPQETDIYFGTLDYMQPKINRLKLDEIKQMLQKLISDGMKPAAPKYIRYISDRGHEYKVKIPENIRAEILSK